MPYGPEAANEDKTSTCMGHFNASGSTLFFNSRDEMIKVRLDRVAYFEADSNYCHVVFINGAKATLLTSLVNIESLLSNHTPDSGALFIRIGKRHIINRQYVFQINIPRQRLTLTDYITPGVLEISISKDALKSLRQILSDN